MITVKGSRPQTMIFLTGSSLKREENGVVLALLLLIFIVELNPA